MNICFLFYIYFEFSQTTHSWLLVGEKRYLRSLGSSQELPIWNLRECFRLIGRSHGVLVQEKAGIKCSFAWCEACDEEAKVNVLVQQFQFFTIIQFWLWKQWLHDDEVKWLLLFDSFICPCTQCDDVLYIFSSFK